MSFLRRIDPFTIAMVVTIGLASILPVSGQSAEVMGWVTNIAIGIMFFLYGARLSRETVIQGATHWRLHLTAFLSTYALFPLLGLAIGLLSPRFLSPELYIGVLFLTTLPSTVQSSIAFTSIAGGNVAAAICSASASNLAGIILTPLLVGVLMSTQESGGFSLHSIEVIALQLLAPFIAGQVLRPWIGPWATKNKKYISITDRGSILLVVYTAFSEAIITGIWHQIDPSSLAVMVVVDAALLAAVLFITTVAARKLGFNKPDEITIVFCGSKKSLATGVPMANVLFAGGPVGVIVLPLMLFHQIQLMVCAAMARRYHAQFERERLEKEAAEAIAASATPAPAKA